MKCYRIKHKPSGLYYCPARKIQVKAKDDRRHYVKSNLSKKGKIYTQIPSLTWIGGMWYHHEVARQGIDQGVDASGMIVNEINEWEIEEI